jgi:DNA-binding transcriptional ArsR family regulator
MPKTTGPRGRRAAAENNPVAEPRWLDAREMAAWLALMRVVHLLPQQLDRQLREQAGITPSRLTHALGSLESRGWVARRPCRTDRRARSLPKPKAILIASAHWESESLAISRSRPAGPVRRDHPGDVGGQGDPRLVERVRRLGRRRVVPR